jgi:hypothetical protein
MQGGAMNRDDIIRMARESGLEQVVSIALDGTKIVSCPPLPELERFANLVAAAEREKLANWMIQRSYATGHGDTTEDLLQELDWQIADGWNRALINGVETEREQCAKLLDEMAAADKLSNYYQVAALRIRERGAP